MSENPEMTQYRRPLIAAWVLTIATILVLSLLPATHPYSDLLSPTVADLGHFPAYGLLTLMTILMLSTMVRSTLMVLLASILAVSMIGGIIEAIQPYFDRTFSVTDLLANIAGATLAGAAYYALVVSRATSGDESS
jgi:VanZ family protein